MGVRRAAQNFFGDTGRALDQMLAAIQDQEDALVLEAGQHRLQRVLRQDMQPQRRGDGGRHAARIGQRRQIDEIRAVAIMAGELPGDREGDARLADPARPHHRQEAALRHEFGQSADYFRAADHPRQRRRQIADGFGARRLQRLVPLAGFRQEAVAAAGNVGNVALAQRLAQRGYVNAQGRFIHEDALPDTANQLRFGDQLAPALDKSNQNVERAAAEPHAAPVFQEHSLL